MSLRSIVCALLVSLMLAGPRAQAGHYTATYTYTFTPPDNTTGPVSATNTTANPAFSQVAYCSGTMTLSVTPTIVWTTDYQGDTSLGPPSVSYIEVANLSMQIRDLSNPPAGVNVTKQTASDDIGNTVTYPAPPEYGVLCSDNKAGGPTSPGPLTARTLTSTFTYSTQDISSGGGAIGYTVYPVYISLSGPVQDSSGNYDILVGQGCTASLSGIPSGYTASNYNWSVSNSASTFQDWEPTTQGNQAASPPVPANSQASYYDPGPGVQTNPTYHWYWNDPARTTETVTCTATVTPPAGQGSAFSVTATQKVTVYVPTRSTNTNMIGDGRVIQSQMKAKATPRMMNNLQEFGSSWKTSVSMPPMPVFGTGQWCYCQLITPGEYLTIDGALQTSTDTTRGEGLDASFPYVSSSTDTGLEPTDGTPYSNEGDSPYLQLNDAYDSATLTDTFHTWVMFKPPGNDSRWVPLSETHWDTDFNANIPPGGWATFSTDETAGPMHLLSDFMSVNTFPKWTQIVPSNPTFIHS